MDPVFSLIIKFVPFLLVLIMPVLLTVDLILNAVAASPESHSLTTTAKHPSLL